MVGRFFSGLFILILLIAIIGGISIAFLADPDARAVELEAQYATPPSQFVVLPSGARVHYRNQGSRSGPALVLLHGSNSSLHTWEPWVAQIGDAFHMISVDLPGHGLTGPVPGDDYSQEGMAKFVDDFTTAIGVERFALAGNSMGGGVAARYALRHPERLTHLILVDAGGMPTKTPRDPGLGFTLARTPVIQYLVLYVTPRNLFEDGLKTAFYNDALVTPEMIDRLWKLNRREGNRAASLKRFQTPDDGYVQNNASQIKTPTLILWGAEDTLTPRDMGDAYNAAITGSKLIVYNKVGHIPMEEVPEQTARAVRDFLTPAPPSP
ncbi:MAG: alpha/beta hydrolase [Alphaproteobacteria bacterium]|nr:alpha/beta hydrolase [Alphaproteobacteria bacterium]